MKAKLLVSAKNTEGEIKFTKAMVNCSFSAWIIFKVQKNIFKIEISSFKFCHL